LIAGRNGGQKMKKLMSALSGDLDSGSRFLAPFLPALSGVADGVQNSLDRHAYLLQQSAYQLCRNHQKRKFINNKIWAKSGEEKMPSTTAPQ